MNVTLSTGKVIPIEMHKVKIVQQTNLPTAAQRLEAIREAGYNTFLLRTRSVFLDMLTDSGTNAMSDNQLGAMMVSDEAYAGSESFYKLADSVKEVLGFQYLLPAHQGRAAEHLLATSPPPRRTWTWPAARCWRSTRTARWRPPAAILSRAIWTRIN
jgi:tryptophanase